MATGCVAATGVNCASNTQIATANSLIALLGGLIGSGNQTFTVASKSGTLAAQPPLRHLLYRWGDLEIALHRRKLSRVAPG